MAGIAALSTLAVGSTGAYFTGAVTTASQTATVGKLDAPASFTASKVSAPNGTTGTRTDVQWSDATPSWAAANSAQYTLERTATGSFDDPASNVRLATDTTTRGLSDTVGGVATGAWQAQQVESTLLQQGNFSLINGRVFFNGSLFKEATSTVMLQSTGVLREITGWGAEVKKISAGRDHVCGLLVTGKVQCWGYNGSGQLGDGTQIDSTVSSAPVSISDVGNVFQGKTIVGVDAGMSFTCAWSADGTTGCWGLNNYGQLGNAGVTGALSTTPVIVDAAKNASGATLAKAPVRFLTAGEFHVCAVRGSITAADGTVTAPSNEESVVCWGRNNWKQLGANVAQNASARNYTPTAVKDTNLQFTGITSIAAGEAVTCVVNDKTTTANIACWGGGGLGVLGDGVGHEEALPVAITSSARGFTAVAIGVWHGCGVTPTQYTCWGTNQNGQLGNNTAVAGGTLFAPQGPFPIGRYLGTKAGSAVSVSVGWLHSCVTTSDGSMACWGLNNNYQLAQNTSTTDLYIPTAVVQNVGTSQSPIYSPMRPRLIRGSGQADSAVGFVNGAVVAWGSSPVTQSGWPSDLTSISQGTDFICGVSASRGLMCGGTLNTSGQLGNGNMTNPTNSAPAVVSDPNQVLTGKTIIDLDSGSRHTCALAADGTIGCWGGNNVGQLGQVNSMMTTNSASVLAVTNYSGNLTAPEKKALEIASGHAFSCVTTPTSVVCWGDNSYGQLGGDRTLAWDNAARPVAGNAFSSGARSLSASRGSVCAIGAADGRAYCWGSNAQGQVGNGGTANAVYLPTLSTTTSTRFKGLETSDFATCGWVDTGAECWGSNQWGTVGRGAVSNSIVGAGAVADPNGVFAGGIRELQAAPASMCAVSLVGAMSCWGYLHSNGTNSSTSTSIPALLAVAMSGGGAPTCRDGAVLLADKKSCSLSPNLTYMYRVTYTVPGATRWTSTPAVVTR
ncbi:MAG: hypothetical protein ABWZ77_02190 [Naasia sp.]